MIFPDTDAVEWAKRYNLSPLEAECRKCGEMQKFDRPFAQGKWRGISSSHFECGDEYRQSICVSLDSEIVAGVLQLFEETNDDRN